MTTAAETHQWVNAYRGAWATNDPDDIRALFTEDAVYNGRPNDPDAWRGHDAIVAGWLEHRDKAGNWQFDYDIVAVTDNTVFIQGVTRYTDGSDYDNLWVVNLDNHRATEFTEWFMARD
jgi:ketosteroid isomerase-like protein